MTERSRCWICGCTPHLDSKGRWVCDNEHLLGGKPKDSEGKDWDALMRTMRDKCEADHAPLDKTREQA